MCRRKFIFCLILHATFGCQETSDKMVVLLGVHLIYTFFRSIKLYFCKDDIRSSDPRVSSHSVPLLQAYSCEKWRSSESKRLNTSESATMWPPSCRAALLWSTPTPRTSPSLTKETGWSDGGQGDRKKRQRWKEKTNMFRCPHESPLCKSLQLSI